MDAVAEKRNPLSFPVIAEIAVPRKPNLSFTTLAAILLFAWTVPLFAATLSVAVDDNLVQSRSGDSADRSVTHRVITGLADNSYLRNGINSASFNYRIVGQVSADDGLGGATDRARLFGSVDLDFNLPVALWDIRVDLTFRGAQDDGSNATASVGVLAMTPSGSATDVGLLTVGSGGLTFFDNRSSRGTVNSTRSGAGTVSIGLDMNAASFDVLLTGGEAYAGIGQFSTLDGFAMDNDLNDRNGFFDDGAFVTLTFTPHLDLNGQTLRGKLILENGEELSGRGRVDGNIGGSALSSISAQGSGLDLGDAFSVNGINFGGTLNVGNSSVILRDANLADLGPATKLAGGTLQAANGIYIGGSDSVSGFGLIAADLVNQGLVDGQGPTAGDGLELSGHVSGAGSYAGNVNFSGTFSPGNSPAEVMLENVALTGILEMEIGGLIAGTEYDWLNVSGIASLGGTLEILLLDLGGGTFMPQAGDSFDIISAETIVGEFDVLQFAALSNGLSWNLDYLFDDIGTDYVRLTVVGAVPLPAAAWLFASALLAVVGLGRRRVIVA